MSQPAEQRPQPHILVRSEHSLSRAEVSKNALKVLYRLHRAGFTAFLVGGAVRDLLLGRRPKDFDIGTDARPQQVRQLFRNARLIGRRFRLARVEFAEEVVEVATFRRSPEPPEIEEGEAADVLAPIRESEEYGSPEDDALRRDFTINGLFYNIADFSVIDWVGGLEDLHAGVVRTIGEPCARFVEDPVRMMRAVEYAARLGFRLDEPTAEAIATMRSEIRRAAPARIAYELLESLKGGQSLAIFRGLEEHGLLVHVVPEAHAAVAGGGGDLLWRLLAAADQLLEKGEKVREETLLGLLFLPGLLAAVGASGPSIEHPDLERVVREQIDGAGARMTFSHYRGHLLRNGFLLLSRLTAPPRSAKAVIRAIRNEAFPVAWELGRLLASATGLYRDRLSLWEQATARVAAGLPAVEERAPAGTHRAHRKRRGRRRRGRQIGSGERPAQP